ncbi:trypsin-like peptidase domain-containing protein [Lentzea pudingi]|uniref:trypsin-like peptidase domain-containing protein n=1 Tax=Lentzea pudingi TaxID=1789439 RepID=UPI00166AF893|nr:trypsin-like peptidase domain-containing protein [Lentzea pudingi]
MARYVLPNLVTIEARHSSGVTTTGSGIRVPIDGIVVTTAHVVGDAAEVWLTLRDGSRRLGSVLGTAPELDVAAVQLPGSTDVAVPVNVGDALAKLKTGDGLFVVCSTVSGPTVTATKVAALSRLVQINQGPAVAILEMNAAIDPPCSGGSLVNTTGDVLGLTTTVAVRPVDDNVTTNSFAIPVPVSRNAVFRIILNR